MSIDLTTKYLPYVDEKFSTESKTAILTNQDFDFVGANAVKIYKVTTGTMNNYGRSGAASGNWSRYGAIQSLDATTEVFTLSRDRSFTFAIDAMDQDETAEQLAAASALERQLREVVVPEIDTYVLGAICSGANAATTPTAKALTAADIYEDIITGSNALDNAEVPETGRVLVVTPDVYLLMKKSSDIIMNTDVGNDMRIRGVIGNLDGMSVLKVPANRLPAAFGFAIVHPSATCAPVKLESYRVHSNPPGISGDLVEGRVVYGAFVMENKNKGIYYQAKTTA